METSSPSKLTASSQAHSNAHTGTNIDRLRLAVACMILAKKPRDISYSSFVFNLQRAFPLSGIDDGGSTGEKYWQARALEMEKTVNSVQTLSDSERAELSALRITYISKSEELNSKTRKKTKAKVTLTPTLEMPTLPPATLIPTLRSMFVIAHDRASERSPHVLVNHFEVTVKHINKSIIPLLTPASLPSTLHLTVKDTRELFTTTLPHLFSATISAAIDAHELWGTQRVAQVSSSSLSLTSVLPDTHSTSLQESLDALLQPIYTDVVVPILHAIIPLAQAHLSSRLLVFNGETLQEQLHPATLLAALSSLVSILDTAGTSHAAHADMLQKCNRALKDCAALCAARQLSRLLSPTESAEAGTDTFTTIRVGNLARKEALHALCTALTLFLSCPPPCRQPTQNSSASLALGATRKQLRDILSEVAVTCSLASSGQCSRAGTAGLSEGEQNALLAVLENAWVHGVWWDETAVVRL